MPRVRGEGGDVKLSRTPTRRIFDESDYGGERKKKKEREKKRGGGGRRYDPMVSLRSMNIQMFKR